MFKINILSQNRADRYQKLIFKIIILSPLRELYTVQIDCSCDLKLFSITATFFFSQ